MFSPFENFWYFLWFCLLWRTGQTLSRYAFIRIVKQCIKGTRSAESATKNYVFLLSLLKRRKLLWSKLYRRIFYEVCLKIEFTFLEVFELRWWNSRTMRTCPRANAVNQLLLSVVSKEVLHIQRNVEYLIYFSILSQNRKLHICNSEQRT